MEMAQIREQAEELTRKLTLEEKIGMIHGAGLFQTKGVERLQIPPFKMSDGPMGVRQSFQQDQWMPLGTSDDYVTYLPCNSALAATWNRKLAEMTGEVLGAEARGRGKDMILAPGINIKRTPLCGRNFEYFSEDPYLTGELAAPFIRGVQAWDVAACVKHFAVNNQETERLWVNVKISEDVLRDIYLPAFQDAVQKGGSLGIMGAYNKLNGTHCCQNTHLLTDILREEWGFDGIAVSDWGGVHETRQTVEAGLDMEMSVTSDFDSYFMAKPLQQAVEAGEIPEELIDRKVEHILSVMIRLHMLDGKRKSGAYNTAEHQQRTRQVAEEALVLLKNEKKRLPLDPGRIRRLLVIGDNASRLHANGGGSAEIKALYEISPLMGIKRFLGGNAEVTYVPGYLPEEEEETAEDVNWQADSLQEKPQEEKLQESVTLGKRRRALREEAVALAAQFEDVIYVGGLNHHQDCEGHDRPDMKLPYGQSQLLQELLEVRPDLIVVLTGGSPVSMQPWLQKADTLLWGWYDGMEGGTALAEVLFGAVNPSGKLPETFYRTHLDCPAYSLGRQNGEKETEYAEGRMVGYRYMDTYGKEPEFCFGYGLSYTTFSYRGPSLECDGQDGRAVVSCLITNTGERAGREVVQVYLAPKSREKDRPVQQLAGFDKISLQPGETREVHIRLEQPFDGILRKYEILIGSSSRDIRQYLF